MSSTVPAALELHNIGKCFGRSEIIRGVSLNIARGERHAIIGPNGAGKSTLFNLISGRFDVSSGRLTLKGRDITHLSPYQITRLGLSRSFQITNLFHRLSAFENLRCSVLWALGYRYSFWRNLNRLTDAEERADSILERVGLKRRRAERWVVGVVTRLQNRKQPGETIAGIEIFAHAPVIVIVNEDVAAAQAETSRSSWGLFIPGDKQAGRRDSLLIDGAVYAQKKQIVMSARNVRYIVQLQNVLRSGDGWQRAEFVVIEKREPKQL